MDVSSILDPLNEQQRLAVTAEPGPLLVLAGAGSGKTRVLVHRIAWLVQAKSVSPYEILAVTFTNKAAAEMRGRIQTLLGIPTQGFWVGTFHGIAHRLLRAHWKDAGLPQNFQILDSEDQHRIIKRIIRDLKLDEEYWPARKAQWFINGKKDAMLRAKDIQLGPNSQDKVFLTIYAAYEETCRIGGLVDFAELLLRAYELWKNNVTILEHYQSRFQHVLVDEFQDTNAIQYAWLNLLVEKSKNLMIVGDDDQSIYGWRGAEIENIRRFEKAFPNTQIIRLEQNYRSTATILAAANSLIANNGDRFGKDLWTEGEKGEAISVYAAFNEYDEANFIANKVALWREQGNSYESVALLYRSNAQSRVLEEQFLQNGIPYRIYGGLRFFERAEIKDVVAYLHLITNQYNDAAFERVVNTPTRGIGQRSVTTLREIAKENSISLWQALHHAIEKELFPARATNALQGFVNLIEEMRETVNGMLLAEQVEHCIYASALRDHYRKEKGEKGQTRLENLDELINAARQFSPEEIEEGLTPLQAFLTNAALEAGERQSEGVEDCVQLMTLHSAKGLEFPLVFICGAEEGLFPHKMSMDDPVRLEEERRLCYVGMTRAMTKLVFTYAELRRLHGYQEAHRPSRFLLEIPKEYLDEVRMKSRVNRPITAERNHQTNYRNPIGDIQNESGFNMGQRVSHAKFGEGTIVNYEGRGAHARVQVTFDGAGSKWLVSSLANLVCS